MNLLQVFGFIIEMTFYLSVLTKTLTGPLQFVVQFKLNSAATIMSLEWRCSLNGRRSVWWLYGRYYRLVHYFPIIIHTRTFLYLLDPPTQATHSGLSRLSNFSSDTTNEDCFNLKNIFFVMPSYNSFLRSDSELIKTKCVLSHANS